MAPTPEESITQSITQVDSRGWVWERQDRQRRAHWVLRNIGPVECYGKDLHIWVGFDWMGDGKWHVGRGGSPHLDELFETAGEAIEASHLIALEEARYHADCALRELNRRHTALKAVLASMGAAA